MMRLPNELSRVDIHTNNCLNKCTTIIANLFYYRLFGAFWQELATGIFQSDCWGGFTILPY